jgi:hypothetical protein
MPSKRLFVLLVSAAVLPFVPPALAGDHPPPAAAAAEAAPKCTHGVAKALCTRCNPKLAPVFKAKGDWCAEHDRPESQCALCHPELARKGVK